MSAAKGSEKWKRTQLTRLQREAAAREAVVAAAELKRLKAEFLARNPVQAVTPFGPKPAGGIVIVP